MTYPKAVQASIAESDWTSISESLREIWPDVCDAARSYLAYFSTRAANVDRLRVYVRPDSGYLHFYVCSAPPRTHQSEIGGIVIPHLEIEYFKLPKSDSEFEREHDVLMLQVRSAIQKACDPELSPLPITIVDYDDLETEIALDEVRD